MSFSRFLLGGLVVMVGIVLLLGQFGIHSGLGRLWPLVVVAFGIYILISNRRNLVPGLFVLTVGILLQLSNFGILPFSVWNLWPLFIVFAGVSILIGKKDYKTMSSSVEQGFIDSNAVFWGDEKLVKGEFSGATINVAFGGSKLDLRDAKIKDKSVIEINLIFGGVEILLPDNVGVINNGIGLFGAFSDKSRRSSLEDTKTIEIRGNAVFGGVDVK